MNKLSIILGASGIIVLVLSIVLGFVVFPKSVETKVKEELKLVRGTAVWNKWIDIESPIYISFHIFNVINPERVNDGSESPKLQEVGPYVYRQRRQKIDPHSESCKETVTYEQKTTYWFDAQRSGDRKEEDFVNIVNVPFISFITVLSRLVASNPELLPPGITLPIISNVILADEKLIRSKVTVGEMLFQGFDVSNYKQLESFLPPEFSGLKFGLYKGRNESTDGQYEIYTAARSVNSGRFGMIKSWNGKPSLSYWNNTECDKLSGGTDGSIFPPFLEEEDSVQIFNTDLCRLLQLTFKEKVEVKGLEGLRFTPPKQVLEGAANNPDNKCYCKRANETECQDGIIDVSVCRNGAPIVLSTPYWLDGFDGYRNAMGLAAADRDKHETRIDIEPRTGLLLEAHKRIQLNMEVRKVEGSSQLINIKEPILFPAMWMDEDASICEVDVADFKSRIEDPIRTVTIVRWVFIGVGILLVILAVAAPFACRKKSAEVA